MPAISIDTFFACLLMVSMVMVATVLSTGILDSRINNLQDLNQDEYFRAVSENILLNPGRPLNWGSNSSVIPEAFGLARNGSLRFGELDIDKICRLNDQNAFGLTYLDILGAARLSDVALRLSISQLLSILVDVFSNTTLEDSVEYTFKISVSEDYMPVSASLHCYLIAKNFLEDYYSYTSDDGYGYADFRIPNSSNGTVALVVFARASYDPRMTACEVYTFGHLSDEPLPNGTFLKLSPLNFTLYVNQSSVDTVIEDGYAFSYEYNSTLASTFNFTYAVPMLIERSPIALIITGSNASTFFIEHTTYPQVPLEAGADLSGSVCYAFSYIVMIKETLFKMVVSFGGISR